MSATALGALPSGVEIAIPKCEPGLGRVILESNLDALIPGVEVRSFQIRPDDRGYFLEVARLASDLGDAFPHATTQVSAAINYPGIIKAFHFHRNQTDFWVPAAGILQVALVDLRCDSKAFGLKNTLYVGTLRPWQLLIPPGVAHGYKVIGKQSSVLIYVTSRIYNPEDEGRIPYNHKDIAYDWKLQHK
jgi:dTDP-4-dehydrorhamnose 3,5-epimerase